MSITFFLRSFALNLPQFCGKGEEMRTPSKWTYCLLIYLNYLGTAKDGHADSYWAESSWITTPPPPHFAWLLNSVLVSATDFRLNWAKSIMIQLKISPLQKHRPNFPHDSLGTLEYAVIQLVSHNHSFCISKGGLIPLTNVRDAWSLVHLLFRHM